VSLFEDPVWLSLIQCIPNSYRVLDLQRKADALAEEGSEPSGLQTELLRSVDSVIVDRSRCEKIAETYAKKVRLPGGVSDQERLDVPIIREEGNVASLQEWARRADALEKLIETISLPRVSVVVLTHNNLELTKVCLNSVIERSEYSDLEIVVVDNAWNDRLSRGISTSPFHGQGHLQSIQCGLRGWEQSGSGGGHG